MIVIKATKYYFILKSGHSAKYNLTTKLTTMLTFLNVSNEMHQIQTEGMFTAHSRLSLIMTNCIQTILKYQCETPKGF